MYKWDEMTPNERDCLVQNEVAKTDYGCDEDENPFYPPYTSDISSAFEIVERMRELGFLFAMYNSVSAGYIVEFANRSTMQRYDASFIPTASEAICKAALKAVGVDIE